MFERIFGPLGTQPLASHIYGLYTGLVYFTPLIGGIIADRVLGQHRTILIGAALMAVGHFMMAFEPLFLIALHVLILGNGAFKPNMSAQVGGLYAPGDHRRDRAYSIFYVGINLGAFLAPLVCGTLGEDVGWHYGFGAAGVGMTIGLADLFLCAAARTRCRPTNCTRSKASRAMQQPLDRAEWQAVLALIALFLPVTLFWATYEQQGNTIALWADDHTDRSINLSDLARRDPDHLVPGVQSVHDLRLHAARDRAVGAAGASAAASRRPSPRWRSAACSARSSYVIMAGAAWEAAGDEASWLWLFAYFVVITIGELYLSPIGLSLVSKVAPVRMVSMLMGVWLGTSFIGNFLAGYLGSFWSSMDKVDFFLMIAAVAAAAAAIIWALHWPLRRVLRD